VVCIKEYWICSAFEPQLGYIPFAAGSRITNVCENVRKGFYNSLCGSCNSFLLIVELP